MFDRGELRPIRSDFRDDRLDGGRTQPADRDQIHAHHARQFGPSSKVGLILALRPRLRGRQIGGKGRKGPKGLGIAVAGDTG